MRSSQSKKAFTDFWSHPLGNDREVIALVGITYEHADSNVRVGSGCGDVEVNREG
jgi:hypothetical protein